MKYAHASMRRFETCEYEYATFQQVKPSLRILVSTM